MSLEQVAKSLPQIVCLSPGQLMVRLCLLDIQTMLYECGRLPELRMCKVQEFCSEAELK